MQWTKILDGAVPVWLFRDSSNVYAVGGPEGIVVIDSGTGYWLDALKSLPATPVAVLLTHHFRDHAAGAVRAAREGIQVYAPEIEWSLLADPQQHFRQRETYIIYDNLWDLNVPIEAVENVQPFLDYEKRLLGGLEFESIPLPGATAGQTGYGLTISPDDQRILFCGEAIHSPGRVPRIAPFQYNYHCTTGSYNAIFSVRQMRKQQPLVLLPSLGDPILQETDAALSQLEDSLIQVVDTFGKGEIDLLPAPDTPELTKVTDHVYVSTYSNARAWFLFNDAHDKVLTIDYGYNTAGQVRFQDLSIPTRRRALLHGIDTLREQFGIEGIDVALISHFHDDHVASVPILQRQFGTECWAADTFAHLLEEPAAHCFPCTWPNPIQVHKRFGVDETVEWEQYQFHFGEMNGHTRFAALIGFEVDGKRFAHTGDQYFFRDHDFPVAPTTDSRMMANHVYRNGCLLGGYEQSARWLLDWRPEVVLTGHTDPIYADDVYFRFISEWTTELEGVHRRAMVLGEGETHFDMDSWGGWIWPYRHVLDEPAPIEVTVTVRNPLPREAKLAVRLVGPQGWQGDSAELVAAARAEVACDLTITPEGNCRRQAFAAELTVDGQPFGQVAEAQVTVGQAWF
ncbi:MAG: MBL fold metallo-hydrolase [Pirellulaceae bacterium]|nr:MBL fold metallo-hydrolase [Pirellulaceae bacterium]